MTDIATTTVLPLIDTDSHVTEPPDLWTSRMPRKFLDVAPRPVWVEAAGEDQWLVGDVLIEGVGRHAVAGWREYAPSYPPSLAEADPASFDSTERLKRMDEYGLYAQVLYPNIIAFTPLEFLKLGPEPALACVRAWNDFLVDFASADPARLVPVMMLPFWDVEASIKEMQRAHDLGHKGVLLAAHFDKGGFPPLWDDQWEPLLSAAQRDLSINFHVGFSALDPSERKSFWERNAADSTRTTSVYLMNNAKAIADIICKGVCHRFPRLKFVSVESGASWLPYLMESLDWQWKNYGGVQEHPERELPSYYFRRQILGTFWFEHDAARSVVEMLPDNIMFETDFPHTTSLAPGPASAAENPRIMAEAALAGVLEAVRRKVFYETAAALYHLEVPTVQLAAAV